MRILIVGEDPRPHALAAALEAAGVEVERPPQGAPGAVDGGEVGELAAELIGFERLLAGGAPDAVLLVSASNPALAAVLVAAKLQIPVAALVEAGPRDGTSELNGRLIDRLADRMVDDEPATIAASLRDLAAA
jgi:UDP-N-acetylglucosamine 2-epimerase